MKTLPSLFVAIAVAFAAGTANAAIIDVSSQDLATNQSNFTACSHSNNTIVTGDISDQCISGPVTAANGAMALGSGFADITTGELKAEANAQATTNAQVSVVSAIGQSRVRETLDITATGPGTVTAYLRVRGDWNLAMVTGAALNFQVQAMVDLTGGSSGTSGNFFVHQSNDSGVGSVDLLLTATEVVTQFTNSLTFDASLLAQIVSATGTIDFGDTASFFIEASDGVSVAYADSRFLSQSVFEFPTQVPEPVGLALFGVGLAGLCFAMRRKAA